MAYERVLERGVAAEGRLADRAGADLHVLRLYCGRHIGGSEVSDSQGLRVEPYSHAVFSTAECLHSTHSLYTAEGIGEVELRIVGKVERVIPLRVVGREGQKHDLVARLLIDAHSLLSHFRRKRGAYERYAVLYFYGGLVEVGAVFKCDGKAVAAVGAGVAAHVEHSLHTVDLLLDWDAYCLRHCRGRGSGVGCANHNRRRSDVGILCYGEREIAHSSGEHHQDCDDGSEDRPVYEEF